MSIYIDNSFSMRSVGQEGDLIETAKKKAREIAQGYREADEFQILTNDFQVEHQQFFNKADFNEQLENIKASPNTKNLSQILERQTSSLKDVEAAKRIAFIISDFQKTTTDLSAITPDSNIIYYFIPLDANQKANIYIDSAWLASPTIQVNQNNQLNFRIANNGGEKVEDLTAKLTINGQQKGLATTTIPANEKVTSNIVYRVSETGWNTGKISIKDYPITFDDQYFISYPVKQNARILAINQDQPNPYLKAAFGTDDYFKFQNRQAGNIDYSNFSNYDLIILNEIKKPSSGLTAEILDFVSEGGNILVLPPPESAEGNSPYSSLLKEVNANRFTGIKEQEQKITQINLDHPLFQDVFEEVPNNVRLPMVQKFYSSTNLAATQERELMSLANGQSLFSLYPYKQGNVFVMTLPLSKEWSNITQNAIFVPLVYKVAFYQERPLQLAYTIGEDQVIDVNKSLNSKDEVYKLTRKSFEIIPAQKMQGGNLRLFLNDQIPEAGIYQLVSNQGPNPNQKMIPHYAFNYNRQESQMATYSTERLQDFSQQNNNINLVTNQYANLAQTIEEMERGESLWRIFIWAALGFLLVEILLLKFLP